MNYKWHYDNLIKTRKSRILIPGVYYERHHIIMKSMGGTNDKENLVYLTAREHFLAHWLLYRIYKNRSTTYSFFCMCNRKNTDRNKNMKKSARAFEEARIAFSNERKGKTMKDETKKKLSEINKGKKHTEETKRKISMQRKESIKNGSKGTKGMKHTEETKKKISKAHKGFHTEEAKRKISKAHIGKYHTEETKRKISEKKKNCIPWNKGKKFN